MMNVINFNTNLFCLCSKSLNNTSERVYILTKIQISQGHLSCKWVILLLLLRLWNTHVRGTVAKLCWKKKEFISNFFSKTHLWSNPP